MLNSELYLLRTRLPIYRRRVAQALEIIQGALKYMRNPYVAFSCGKDSSVLAHLVLSVRPGTPLRFLSSGETRLVHNVDDVLEFFRRMGGDIQEINIDRVFSPEWINATWDEQRKAGNKDLELLNDPKYDGIFMGLRAEESRPRRISLYTRQDKDLPPFCHKYTTGKRLNMIRCCPLAQWTTEDVGGYILQHGIPYLDWYALHEEGFKERTTARLTGDSVRQNSLFWLKKHKPDNFNVLTQRFPEFRMYV